jgi:hypothetical protein
MLRLKNPLYALLSSLALALIAPPARADVPSSSSSGENAGLRPLGFSNLVFRLESTDEIGIAGEDFRVHILESLRENGFNAVGAESLVFGKDASRRAELLLGGTVRELDCIEKYGRLNCRIGVEWQLLDVMRDAVVYTVMSRHREIGGLRTNLKPFGKNLLMGALLALMSRSQFVSALRAVPNLASDTPTYAKAGIKKCQAAALQMPGSAEEALRATVLVKSNDGFGSGFLLTPDGLVLTAAHVVTGSDLSLRMRDGTAHKAVPIRIARNVDTALLKITDLDAATTPCLPLNLEPKAVGAEVYAIGSPASQKLAFSLTRGIISGVRNFDGTQFLQTDASISPGNSGGPLIDAHGRATAIVSWKVAGATVEGIAFGIPVEEGLAALGIAPSTTTDPAIAEAKAIDLGAGSARKNPAPDAPDPKPGLDPDAEREQERLRQQAELERQAADRKAQAEAKERERAIRRARLTPSYVPILRYGGAALAAVGGLAVVVSYTQYDSQVTTEPEFRQLRLANDLGWAALGLGAAGVAASYLLMPKLPKDLARAPGLTPRFALGVTPAAVRVDVGLEL